MEKIFLLFFFFTCGKIFSQETCAKNIAAPVLSETARKEFEQKLSSAEADYRKDSTNADAIIWYGRRKAYLGHYLEAIDIFTRGIELHPGDARFYRHRGHRYISIRCFDKAISDFEQAALLIKGKGDEVEPDGLPNAKNIPTSTLQSNIWYHLGLALFIKGEHKKAAKAYEKCLAVATNDDMYVATVNWSYLNLLKLKEYKKAGKLLNSVNPNAVIIENQDYWKLYDNLYSDKPYTKDVNAAANLMLKEAGQLGVSTISFAVGFYCLAKGYDEKAQEFFKKAVSTNQWSSFGFIAAEAELSRITRISAN